MYKLLIVEDEERIRKGLTLATDWEKYNIEVVGSACDGMEGIDMIRTLQPDIVITDIRMPGMDGLTMIEALKDKHQCEYIILSGYDEFTYAKKAMHLDVHSYLLKPIDDQELADTLADTIRRVDEKRALQHMLVEKDVSAPEEKDLPAPLGLQDKYMQKACTLLKERYSENITLKNVADELYISESYLGKLFKTHTGYTFLEMLTFYRMKAAISLLQTTDLKIYEVSCQVGYTDTRYFSKLFRRITGLKPMEIKNGLLPAQDNILNTI